MNKIIEYFKIPDKAIPQMSNNKIPVTKIIEAGEFVGQDKRILEKSIASITIEALINEDTSQIWKYCDDNYRYEEVQFFYVILKQEKDINRLNELLQGLFPNPCVFVYQIGEKYAFSTALKRMNKNNLSKSVIESIELTNFFKMDSNHTELISKVETSSKNLMIYYKQLDNLIASEEIISLTGKVPNVINDDTKLLAQEIKKILKQRKELEAELKEADSMREKMSLTMKVKEINHKLEDF